MTRPAPHFSTGGAFEISGGRKPTGDRWMSLLQAAVFLSLIPGCLLLEVENPEWLVTALAVGALLQLPGEFVPEEWIDVHRIGGIAVVAVLASVAEPRVWMIAILALSLTAQWVVQRSAEPFRALTFNLTALGMVLVVGALSGAAFWPGITVSVVIIEIGFIFAGRRVRNLVETSHEEILKVLMETNALVYEIDLETSEYISFQGPVQELTGYTAEEFHRLAPTIIHPDDIDDFWIRPEDVTAGSLIDRTGRFRSKSGEWIWLRELSRTVATDGRKRIIGFAVDVTESQSELTTMRRRAQLDALTGVGNRFALVDELSARLLDNRDGYRQFALLLLDLDRFKEVNDTLGHDYGDEALRSLADRLHATMRPGDLLARLGGDEFAVIAGNVQNYEQAVVVAERIASACAMPLQIRSVTVQMSASIGVVVRDEAHVDPDELLRSADVAMYAAKRSGRRFHLHAPSGDGAGSIEEVLAAQLGAALNEDEIELWFQPKYDFVKKRLAGVEGLARWRHPEYGMLGPDEFVHLFGVSTAAGQFTDEMIDAGLAFASAVAKLEPDFTVSVNASVLSLYDDAFPLRLRGMLARHGVDPSRLILEITEKDIMDEAAGAPPVLTRLSNLGVSLSIDDFGTGYSSLARLRDLPVSEIKIDKRFVTGAVGSESDRVIVRSIIDLGHNLGLKVVGEGVETEREQALLTDMGCDLGQGYLYGKPMLAHELIALVSAPPLQLVAGTDVDADDGDDPVETAG